MGRERRRRTRRSTAASGAGVPGMIPGADTDAPVTGRPVRASSTAATVQVRSDRVIAREAATMIAEMKRVAVVSAVCFGMLAILVVVQRLQ
jgi:hypothetical protein